MSTNVSVLSALGVSLRSYSREGKRTKSRIGEVARDTQDLNRGADVGALRFIGFLNHGDVAVGGSLIDFSAPYSRAVQNFIARREAFRSARLPGILCNPPGARLPRCQRNLTNRLQTLAPGEISELTVTNRYFESSGISASHPTKRKTNARLVRNRYGLPTVYHLSAEANRKIRYRILFY